MRGATIHLVGGFKVSVFQSTRSMRGATVPSDEFVTYVLFQSTRPMRGATSSGHPSPYPCRCFNPRAPCGARRPSLMDGASFLMFQSTRPMRGATDSKGGQQLSDAVSIHAPHAGRDSPDSSGVLTAVGFNPRAPCGARPPWSRR